MLYLWKRFSDAAFFLQFENYSNSRQVWPWKSFLQMLWGPNAGADISRCMCLCVLLFICVLAWELQGEPLWMQDFQCHAVSQCCWAEAPIKIARMTLTIKLDGNWSSFQLANSAPPLSVTGSATAPSARMMHWLLRVDSNFPHCKQVCYAQDTRIHNLSVLFQGNVSSTKV